MGLSPLMFTEELKALRKCTDRAVRTWARKVREEFGLLQRDILPDEIVAKAMGISLERLLMWRIEYQEGKGKRNTFCLVPGLMLLEFMIRKLAGVSTVNIFN